MIFASNQQALGHEFRPAWDSQIILCAEYPGRFIHISTGIRAAEGIDYGQCFFVAHCEPHAESVAQSSALDAYRRCCYGRAAGCRIRVCQRELAYRYRKIRPMLEDVLASQVEDFAVSPHILPSPGLRGDRDYDAPQVRA